MSKKSQEKEMDDFPEIEVTEIQEAEEKVDKSQPVNKEVSRKEKVMREETKCVCPICREKTLVIIARGKNKRVWACASKKCSEAPLKMSLFFQVGANVPVIWEMSTNGQMHALVENKANQN